MTGRRCVAIGNREREGAGSPRVGGNRAVAVLTVEAPPRDGAPPPPRPAPAVKVKDGFASMPLSTPAGAMLRLTAPVVPPPVRPEPAITLVTVPEPPPRGVWPGAKLIVPLAFTLRPVSAIVRFEPNRGF